MSKSSAKARRTAARLAAAQALYQLELGDELTTKQAVYDLLQMHQDDMPEELITPDQDLLQKITDAASARLQDIDGLIAGATQQTRSLDRAEAVLRAIMRAGVAEMLVDGETPAGILINDYVNVAHAFFSEAEPGKVNAVLNAVARSLGRLPESGAATASAGT